MFWLKFSLFAGICLALVRPAVADSSVYDLINQEDTVTFSDLFVLGYGVDDADADGYTPLMIAAALGKAKFVGFLIENGADVNRCSYNGSTALHRAAQAGHEDVIDVLLDSGAFVDTPDFDGFTPLMMAVTANRRFTVEHLVKRGANLGFQNAKGKTALDLAREKRFQEIATFLEMEQ